jgi:phosphate-selective porin OprO/OprP
VITPNSLNFTNGGKQVGYQASLIWLPTDYVKFMVQYGHINVTGGPAATAAFSTVKPLFYDSKYSTDTFTMRAQLDF